MYYFSHFHASTTFNTGAFIIVIRLVSIKTEPQPFSGVI